MRTAVGAGARGTAAGSVRSVGTAGFPGREGFPSKSGGIFLRALFFRVSDFGFPFVWKAFFSGMECYRSPQHRVTPAFK